MCPEVSCIIDKTAQYPISCKTCIQKSAKKSPLPLRKRLSIGYLSRSVSEKMHPRFDCLQLFKYIALWRAAEWTTGFLGHTWAVAAVVLYVLCESSAQRKEGRDSSSKEPIKTSETHWDDDLPAMEIEDDGDPVRAEWVNKIVQHLWPYFTEHATRSIRRAQEKRMERKSVLHKLLNFSIKEINLGEIPPRFSCIMIKRNTRRNLIVVEANFRYDGDANFLISVIQGSLVTIGISDLKVQGRIRLEFGPPVSRPPLVASVSISFPLPDLQFTTKGRLAQTFTRVRDVVERSIVAWLDKTLVYPNQWSLSLSKSATAVHNFRPSSTNSTAKMHYIPRWRLLLLWGYFYVRSFSVFQIILFLCLIAGLVYITVEVLLVIITWIHLKYTS